MQAFIDAAAAAEVQTELAARVGEWQGKVCTVLEEQDARPPFDLQAYGTGLLERLSDLSLRHAPDHWDIHAKSKACAEPSSATM